MQRCANVHHGSIRSARTLLAQGKHFSLLTMPDLRQDA